MRKRHLGILLLSAFAIFFSLQEAWFHLSDDYLIKYEERLPPPIVDDINGDGKMEILVATHDAKVQLHLQGGLHADINGDRVLDHVQAVGGNGAEKTVVSGFMEVQRPCWVVTTSGVPIQEQLFNASICHHTPYNFFQHGEFARSFGRTGDVSSLEVATPILVKRIYDRKHWKGNHGDVVFLTNHGEVTCYSPGVLHGHDAIWRWQLLTGATWSNLPSPSGMMEAWVVPTLKAFSLRVQDNQELILAAGDQEAVVVSPQGSQLASIDLSVAPTHALIR